MKRQEELLYVDLPNLVNKILKHSYKHTNLSINVVAKEIERLVKVEIDSVVSQKIKQNKPPQNIKHIFPYEFKQILQNKNK